MSSSDKSEDKENKRITFKESDYIDDLYNSTTENNITNDIEVVKNKDVSHETHDLYSPTRRKINNNNKEENEENHTEIQPSQEEKHTKFKELKINEVVPNPDQPRTNFDKEKLQELADSIREKGVLQPILVRKIDNHYQIIAGERRWQASKIAGQETIPAIITEKDDDQSLELALIENIQRDDLNPIEEAWGYKRLMDKLNITQAQLAVAVSKGRSTIANSIRLLDLPEEAQELMFNNQLTAGHARAILSIPTPKGREKLIEKIKNEKINVREAESFAKLMSLNVSTLNKQTKYNPASYKAIAKALKSQLNTSVKVKTSGGNNRIEISFNDEDDLQRIYEILSK